MALKSRCRIEIIAPLPWVPFFMKRVGEKKFVHSNVPSQEYWGGLTVHHPRYMVIPRAMGFMHPVFMFTPLFSLIKRLDKKEPIDLINAHWLFPDGVATAWVAQKLGKPLILTGLGCDINYYPSLPFRKQQIKKALELANLISVKGSELKQKILHMGIQEHKVIVIPNGLDLKRFRIMDRKEARRRLDLQEDGRILLFVGSLDQVKGCQYLIEAFKGMADNLEYLPHLIVVGDGPQQEALLFQTRRLGIADRVSFVGKRPHDEIPLWMNAANVFCLPSIREGRPNVLMEALACGTSAVASNVGSVPEIIHKENGRIAGVADPKNLCRQLIVCLNQGWDRESIRKTVGNYTWEDCAKHYIRAYQQAVSENF
ncbi:MAG: glycosyltransferase [Deltaproteobacteria bacterium]|jgi:teichuronic acid biosynthesis glycosyltransferase TuaC|nr:glycosyltransferase [Deltaproteobacteria bacterium]